MRQELIVEVYRRLVAVCRTVNKLNRLNIRFENRMTPREKLILLEELDAERLSVKLTFHRRLMGSNEHGWIVRRLEASKRKIDLFEARQAWARRLRENAITSASQAARWARVPISTGVVLYRRLDVETSRLAVSFTGAAARMMVALPDYLTAIEPADADVLLVRTDRSGGYLRDAPESITGFGPSFGMLKATIKKHGYTDLKVIGVSGGVLPALVSCAYLVPSSVLVVGPPQGHISKFGEELVQLLNNQPRLRATRYFVAYGSDSEDEESALFLSESLGGQSMRVDGAGHAAMRELNDQFSLAKTLMSESGAKEIL